MHLCIVKQIRQRFSSQEQVKINGSLQADIVKSPSTVRIVAFPELHVSIKALGYIWTAASLSVTQSISLGAKRKANHKKPCGILHSSR